MIGPQADSVRSLFSGYTPAAAAELTVALLGSGAHEGDALAAAADAESAMGSVTTTAPAEIERAVRSLYPESRSVLQAIREAVSEATEIVFVAGCTVNGTSTEGIPEAVAAAQRADVVILVVGDKTGWMFDCTSGEGRDRSTLDLPGMQEQLVTAVCATGTPVVAVLVNGRPAPVGARPGQPAAVLGAWQPGAVGAEHLAAILFGDDSPSGKLPLTIPRTAGQCPIFHYQRAGSSYAGSGQGLQRYTDTELTPAYPFGHGLGYTTFDYQALTVNAAEVAADGSVDVTVTVANTGDRDGEEVVQLYARTALRGLTRPERELLGFKRVHLDVGASCDITFRLELAQLAFLGHDLELAVHPAPSNCGRVARPRSSPSLARSRSAGPPRSLQHRTVFWPSVHVRER